LAFVIFYHGNNGVDAKRFLLVGHGTIKIPLHIFSSYDEYCSSISHPSALCCDVFLGSSTSRCFAV